MERKFDGYRLFLLAVTVVVLLPVNGYDKFYKEMREKLAEIQNVASSLESELYELKKNKKENLNKLKNKHKKS